MGSNSKGKTRRGSRKVRANSKWNDCKNQRDDGRLASVELGHARQGRNSDGSFEDSNDCSTRERC